MIHPTVTLIIPTYNRPQRLCECLTAVAALDYPRDRFDVVVVDDGSPQPVASVVEEVVASTKAKLGDSLRAQTIRQQNAGPAAARNAGAHHATGNFLAFTDDDCAPDPNWLHRMAAQLDQQPNALVGGRTVNALVDNPVSEAAQSLIDYIYAYENQRPGDARFFASNNIAMSTRCFHQIGGFDTSYPLAAGEDREFCDRWRAASLPRIYAPNAIIHHRHAMTVRSFWRQNFNYGRGGYQVHQTRAQQSGGGVRFEALNFYAGLLAYPLRSRGVTGRALGETALFALSQVAIGSGYLREKRQRPAQGAND